MSRKRPTLELDDATLGDDPHPTPRRERQTEIPPFDPADLAREVEASSVRPTTTPPFDPAAYARIVDEHVTSAGAARDTPRTLTAANEATSEDLDIDGVGREMYGSYLASDFPSALTLAEQVLSAQPDHALAQLVAMRCRARMASDTPRLSPESIVRLRSSAEEIRAIALDATSVLVLEHVDGVSDADSLAERLPIPRAETLDKLHELLELGVVEIVAAAS